MALSDYDLLAFDTKCRPCNGVFKSGNTSVRVYKNWVYVSNTKMWVPNESSFVFPTIAQITGGGEVNIGKVSIHTSWDTNQNSIFVACISRQPRTKMMVGIGCYGHINTTKIYAERLGLDPNLDWFGGSRHHDGKSDEMISRFIDEGNGGMEEYIVPPEFVIDDTWVGVSQETYQNFIRFLEDLVKESYLDEKYFDLIKKQTPLRASQGDMYFATHLGREQTGTPIGQAEIPIALQMLKGPK